MGRCGDVCHRPRFLAGLVDVSKAGRAPRERKKEQDQLYPNGDFDQDRVLRMVCKNCGHDESEAVRVKEELQQAENEKEHMLYKLKGTDLTEDEQERMLYKLKGADLTEDEQERMLYKLKEIGRAHV